MATEILAVPEESLGQVILVIKAGVKAVGKDIDKKVRKMLLQWCKDEEDYLKTSGWDE